MAFIKGSSSYNLMAGKKYYFFQAQDIVSKHNLNNQKNTPANLQFL